MRGKSIFAKATECFLRGLLMIFGKRAKKWQTCKDSNLNKVNQNHLCYRYTTGLRCVHNIYCLFSFFNR